jgi:hypothetical protein
MANDQETCQTQAWVLRGSQETVQGSAGAFAYLGAILAVGKPIVWHDLVNVHAAQTGKTIDTLALVSNLSNCPTSACMLRWHDMRSIPG